MLGKPSDENTPPRLKALEEIEKEGLPGLIEVPREEGLDAIRYVLSLYCSTNSSRSATVPVAEHYAPVS